MEFNILNTNFESWSNCFQDQVLSNMQQKLDSLCEQLNNVNSLSSVKPPANEVFGSDKTKFVDCGCWLCDQHHNLFNKSAVRIHSISCCTFILAIVVCNFLYFLLKLKACISS